MKVLLKWFHLKWSQISPTDSKLACESIRVFSTQVSSFTRETRNLSRKNRMLSQANSKLKIWYMVAQFTMEVKKNTVELACAMENYKTVTPKSSPDRFRDVVVYKSFQQYGFDWEILLFWIYGRLGEVIANETRTHMQVRLYFMPVTVHRTKKLY